MSENKSLFHLSLEDLFLANELEKYKVPIKSDSTVGTLIYEHLNSKPGFIRHKRATETKPHVEKNYLDAIHKVVSKGAPLEIFISAFNPKVTNPTITNGHLYPDMADLLTLIHLHLVAKGIRDIYDYGFRFIIGYRGFIYQDFFQWKDEDVKKSYEVLEQLIAVAENIVGIRNVVQLADNRELINKQGSEFQVRLQKEIFFVEEKYQQKDPYYLRKIDAWIKDFRRAIDNKSFPSLEKMEEHLLKYAIYFRALKNIEYTGGKHNLGICNDFPNVLRATIRGLDEKISIQFSPFFRFHSHQRLISLTKDNNWNTLTWKEMQELHSSFKAVYFHEFSHPFYFEEE